MRQDRREKIEAAVRQLEVVSFDSTAGTRSAVINVGVALLGALVLVADEIVDAVKEKK